jgi:hypothetical protein
MVCGGSDLSVLRVTGCDLTPGRIDGYIGLPALARWNRASFMQARMISPTPIGIARTPNLVISLTT